VADPAVDDQVFAEVCRDLYATFAAIDRGLQYLLQRGIVSTHRMSSIDKAIPVL
jgi:hypothetical protein